MFQLANASDIEENDYPDPEDASFLCYLIVRNLEMLTGTCTWFNYYTYSIKKGFLDCSFLICNSLRNFIDTNSLIPKKSIPDYVLQPIYNQFNKVTKQKRLLDNIEKESSILNPYLFLFLGKMLHNNKQVKKKKIPGYFYI
jgi:hypothetical protein